MVDKQLLYVTTLITTESRGKHYSASGFFYQQENPAMENNKLGNYWLITNRHVIYVKNESEGQADLVEKLTFRVRVEVDSTKELKWLEVSLSQEELLEKAKVLDNIAIDVAVIDVCDKVEEVLNGYGNRINITISPIGPNTLADKSAFPIEVCDDVAVIGYPGGYYDMHNLYPIVKTGTIASMWGADFRGAKGFAIDAKLFPGSSGSLVITKPRRETLKDGKYLEFKVDKLYYCLGIYSGEPLFDKEKTFDLGMVWYFCLIPETIAQGSAPVIQYKYK